MLSSCRYIFSYGRLPPTSVSITDILLSRFDWPKRRSFGNDHPIELDLGAGDGGFAIALKPGEANIRFTIDHAHYLETVEQAMLGANVRKPAPKWKLCRPTPALTDIQKTFDARVPRYPPGPLGQTVILSCAPAHVIG